MLYYFLLKKNLNNSNFNFSKEEMSDNSDAVSEYNGYDIKAPSISEHLPLTEVPQNIIALRIMHSTSLKSMKVLFFLSRTMKITN